MVTRKHFEDIANILGHNTIPDKRFDAIVHALSTLFYKYNSRFDRAKFYEAIINQKKEV